MRSLICHLLPKLTVFPGKMRLAKLLLGDTSGPARIKDRFKFIYEVPDLREPIAFHLLIDGSYEPEVQDLLHDILEPGSTFIDVGANIGSFTIPAARVVGPSGRVIAIEASPEVHDALNRNIMLNNLENVNVIGAAAAARDGETQFYPAPIDHFGMGSRAPQFDATPLNVRSVTIDSLVEKLNLERVLALKIDVEGFELDVLKGAVKLLDSKTPPVIVFEFCDWAEARMSPGAIGETQRFLMRRGFRIWKLAAYDHGPFLSTPLRIGAEMLVARR